MDTALDMALQANDLYHIYDASQVRTVALRGAQMGLARGTWTVLMGPSGSGKSTLLHIIAGLLNPSAGSVVSGGVDVTRLPPSARANWRRRNVGLVLQRDNLHPHLDVAGNIALPLRLQRLAAGEIHARVQALLGQVGLQDRGQRRAGQLSGGEAQRAAIATALSTRPAVLLADEPTGELDEATAAGILDLLAGLARQGMAILTVTHNQQVAQRASHHLVMHDGMVTDAR